MKFQEVPSIERNLNLAGAEKIRRKFKDTGAEEDLEIELIEDDFIKNEGDSCDKIDNEAKKFPSRIEMVEKIKKDTEKFNVDVKEKVEKSVNSGPSD